jgi:hypothetical protein
MKRLLACLLVMATLAGGSAAFAAFPDVTDAETSRAVDALTMLGILDGLPDGTFGPNLTLTRSQFCKMAVMATADRDLVGRYKSYTILPGRPLQPLGRRVHQPGRERHDALHYRLPDRENWSGGLHHLRAGGHDPHAPARLYGFRRGHELAGRLPRRSR